MWGNRSSIYAGEQDEFVSAPLTKSPRTRWQRIKSWVRERPKTAALLAILVVGVVIAVIVGPVVAHQRREHDQDADARDTSTDTEYKMTFQAQNASQLCTSFNDSGFLSSYGSALQNSIAGVLGVQGDRVIIQSVQCGTDSYQLPSGYASRKSSHRRLLQDPSLGANPGNAGVSLVVVFRLVTMPTDDGAPPDPMSVASVVASTLQSIQGKAVLQQAVSQALGIPSGTVFLISVEAGGVPMVEDNDPPMPPPLQPTPSPMGSLSIPPLPGMYGGSGVGVGGGSGDGDGNGEGLVPPTYPPPSPSASTNQGPPVYGSGGEHQPPPRPPVYLQFGSV